MSDRPGKPSKRSAAAARFDRITLAALATTVLMLVAAVFTLGVSTAGDRLGCGLNDLVNYLLAYPRSCR